MTELADFLKHLISLPGLSGNEAPVREVIAETWQPLVNELSTSRLGSLHGLRRGSMTEPRRSIMIATHMDAIGLMVTTISEGLLHITDVGGIDPRILPGTMVTVHGRRDLPAVVIQPPDRLLPADARSKPVEMKYLLVDTGLLPAEVAELVRPGDLISFAQPALELPGETIVGHTLDNRASVAALTACLQELQHVTHSWDVWAVATTQEEETLGGGYTSAFALRPDLAIAIDVTFAKGPGANEWRAHPLGKAVPISFGPNIHPAVYAQLKSVAEKLDIPFRADPLPRHSGTDAYAMQVVAEGIPSGVLNIPLRYMHTPVEMISMKDIERTGHLLAQFIARLEPDFLEKITWDD